MQTIIQIDSALVWTGATADINDHDGIPYGWVAVPAAPTLVEGEYAVVVGNGLFEIKTGVAPVAPPPDVDNSLREVGSFADLQAYSGSSESLYVRGCKNVLDGGGGLFRVDTGDTTSPQVYGICLVDTFGRRWKREYSGPINVKWCGARGNSGSNPLSGEYATLAAAQADYPDAVSMTDELDWCAGQSILNIGADVFWPQGVYRTNRPLVQKKQVRFFGEGGKKSRIQNGASDILWLGGVGGESNQSVFENIGLVSLVGGGNVFTQKGHVLFYEFRNLYIEQLNQGSSVYSHTEDLGNHLCNYWIGGRYYHAHGSTAPGFHFRVTTSAGATNSNTWSDIEVVRGSKPWFLFESNRPNNYLYDLRLINVRASVTGGGVVVARGVNSCLFDITIYDLEFSGYLNAANLVVIERSVAELSQPSRFVTIKLKRITPNEQLSGYQDILFTKPASGYAAEDVTFLECAPGVTGSLSVTTNTGAILRAVSTRSRLSVTGDAVPAG